VKIFSNRLPRPRITVKAKAKAKAKAKDLSRKAKDLGPKAKDGLKDQGQGLTSLHKRRRIYATDVVRANLVREFLICSNRDSTHSLDVHL